MDILITSKSSVILNLRMDVKERTYVQITAYLPCVYGQITCKIVLLMLL